MKYTFILPGTEIPAHIKGALSEQPARSGCYNWIFAHKGEINTWNTVKDRLEDFDYLHVNMAPVDMPLAHEIRRLLPKSSSTKLILNNDYVCEKWGQWGMDPFYYEQTQRCADMLFSTEPHQVSNMINGTFVIPHPTNTRALKRFGVDRLSGDNSLAAIYHWWAPESYLMARTAKKMVDKHNLSGTKLMGFKDIPGKNPFTRWHGQVYDTVHGMMNFEAFAQEIQKSRVVYDPNSCHTYGRNGVECACFRKPMVGSNRVFSQNKLFPELACDPYDFNETAKKFDKVFSKDVGDILDKAYDEVEYFSYKNSLNRWNIAVEEATKRGGHEFYEKQ